MESTEAELSEAEFIDKSLAELKILLQALPSQMAQAVDSVEKAIEDLQREAKIHLKVKDLRDRLDAHRKTLQTKADDIQGRMAALEEIKEAYHRPDYSHIIPEGVTHMHGIELAKHKHHLETLARIIRGESDTIEVLGGKLEEETSEAEIEAPPYEEDEDLLDLLS
jgi:small-conductance mechanosensitive channel